MKSHKQLMREALELTEKNLGSLIASRDDLGLGDFTVLGQLLVGWRDVARRALGHIVDSPECICTRCGIRHGGSTAPGDF